MLIPLLKAAGHHIVGLVRKPVDVGADEIVTDWMHAAAAREALAGADAVVHLSGELNAKNERMYAAANKMTTEVVAANARAGCIIYLSYPHANPGAKNYYLRYKGVAEALLGRTGIPLVIFRCPVIIDAPDVSSKIDVLFKSVKGRPVPVIGSGLQKMRPVYRGTVAAAIASALLGGRPGVYELSGPDEMTVDEFIRLANPAGTRLLHIPGWLAYVLSGILPGLSSTFVDMMLHYTASEYDPAAYKEFGVEPVSIVEMWRRGSNVFED
jgi:NADH dehydrogenase